MQQQGSRTAEEALKGFMGAHARGWVILCGLSDFTEPECYSRALYLFRNRQKEWNVFKKVVRYLEKVYNPAEPKGHDYLQEIWRAFRRPAGMRTPEWGKGVY